MTTKDSKTRDERSKKSRFDSCKSRLKVKSNQVYRLFSRTHTRQALEISTPKQQAHAQELDKNSHATKPDSPCRTEVQQDHHLEINSSTRTKQDTTRGTVDVESIGDASMNVGDDKYLTAASALTLRIARFTSEASLYSSVPSSTVYHAELKQLVVPDNSSLLRGDWQLSVPSLPSSNYSAHKDSTTAAKK